MEVHITVGRSERLALGRGLLLGVGTLVGLLLLVLEVGEAHILERYCRQFEIYALAALYCNLTIETEFHTRALVLGVQVTVFDIEVGLLLVEADLGQHEVKGYLVFNLLHAEVYLNALLVILHGICNLGLIAYLGLLFLTAIAIFLFTAFIIALVILLVVRCLGIEQRYLYTSVDSGIAKVALLYIEPNFVDGYVPTTHLGSTLVQETVNTDIH